MSETVEVPGRRVPVASKADVVVVGGGSAGTTAAVAAARAGAKVTLLERYGFLGGMASGGMVLVLDDMVNEQTEVTVHGLVDEFIERLSKIGKAAYPSEQEWGLNPESVAKWTRWGLHDFRWKGKPKPIIHAVAFDPEGWKDVSNDLVREANVELRLHSMFTAPILEGNRLRGVVVETKEGPQAVLGEIVIDTSGDADVVFAAGGDFVSDTYLVTTVFRLGNVDTDTAERFEWEHPDEAEAINRQARQVLGGSWDMWWLKTPLPGVVWCNAPHMGGYVATDPVSLTAAQFEGRTRVNSLVAFVRENYPGFEKAVLLDVASQIGVRQSRLVVGDYVVTRDDIRQRRHFKDSVARGRDYYTPYRAMLPKGLDQILVAGRHYSATPSAQRVSREIPPCMAMGEAAGIAAALALETGVTVREVDVTTLQRRLRDVGADPGDIPSANALVDDASDPVSAGA